MKSKDLGKGKGVRFDGYEILRSRQAKTVNSEETDAAVSQDVDPTAERTNQRVSSGAVPTRTSGPVRR